MSLKWLRSTSPGRPEKTWACNGFEARAPEGRKKHEPVMASKKEPPENRDLWAWNGFEARAPEGRKKHEPVMASKYEPQKAEIHEPEMASKYEP